MCRLFGLTAGTRPVSATFWLLDAPDSLEAQSHRNADGSGIGYFSPGGQPVLNKQPVAAFGDAEFRKTAARATAARFVAHVRWATAGGRTVANTHPFAMHDRIFAHNGGFGEASRVTERLGQYRGLVQGETDSERYFALITQQIDAHDGDVAAGITAAAGWIGANLPVSSLNAILVSRTGLWALRYPGQHALHVIERPAGGGLHVRSATSSVHAPDLDDAPTVVVASEALDGEHGWRMLAAGELLHVGPDLTVTSSVVLPDPPARLVPIPPNPNIDT